MALNTFAPETVVYFPHNNQGMFDALRSAGLLRQINEVELTRISLFIKDHEELFPEMDCTMHWFWTLPEWPIWGMETEEGILAVVEFPKQED